MLRTSLVSISSNRRRNTQYTSFQKGIIIEVIDGGLTPFRIQKQYRVLESSVRYIFQNHFNNDDGEAKPRFDVFKKLRIRDERHIIRIVRRNFKIIYRDFIKQAEMDVCSKIIQRLLKEEGIINWLCKKQFLLTFELTDKRYAWTLQHQDWKWKNWAKVIWFNECSVE